MSRLRTISPPKKRQNKRDDLTLADALKRVDDPDMSKHLSFFFAELSRFQVEGDEEGIRESHRAIAEVMRGLPEGEIDVPLLQALRKRSKKRKR